MCQTDASLPDALSCAFHAGSGPQRSFVSKGMDIFMPSNTAIGCSLELKE